jgi:D-glycero-D-manno-heptose 1,7-bisphosphate phosphatase
MKRKAVFLDRDGTLIVDKVYLNDIHAIEYYPDAFVTMKRLYEAGFLLVVATNQSGIPKGLVSLENLHRIHEILQNDFTKSGAPIAGFYYAPYLVDSNHPLRKPHPGMLLAGARDFEIDLTQSWMVGDRMTDVEAGHRAGTRTILLEGTEKPEAFDFAPPFGVAKNLTEAVELILKHSPA